MSHEVQLRDVRESDLEVFYEQEQDPEASRRARFPSRERTRFMTHWTTRILANPTGHVQAITVDDLPAGHLVAWWEEDKRYIGYWLDRRYWAQGIGTRALALFLAKERTRPLYADPASTNTASVRLLLKSGFRPVGPVHHDGEEHLLLVLGAEQG
ncbi:GNAT family N-acetyltransferase [Sphaerisporangium aureirubrum]|uniref:GNAT family N-acetyltransferase n=1 Tax=Sphaerisporangium aureirubrum TaxID=1544736 RepID=A0ABW1N8Y7_9ACTN